MQMKSARECRAAGRSCRPPPGGSAGCRAHALQPAPVAQLAHQQPAPALGTAASTLDPKPWILEAPSSSLPTSPAPPASQPAVQVRQQQLLLQPFNPGPQTLRRTCTTWQVAQSASQSSRCAAAGRARLRASCSWRAWVRPLCGSCHSTVYSGSGLGPSAPTSAPESQCRAQGPEARVQAVPPSPAWPAQGALSRPAARPLWRQPHGRPPLPFSAHSGGGWGPSARTASPGLDLVPVVQGAAHTSPAKPRVRNPDLQGLFELWPALWAAGRAAPCSRRSSRPFPLPAKPSCPHQDKPASGRMRNTLGV